MKTSINTLFLIIKEKFSRLSLPLIENNPTIDASKTYFPKFRSSSRLIILLGDAGSGKSTLLKQFVYERSQIFLDSTSKKLLIYLSLAGNELSNLGQLIETYFKIIIKLSADEINWMKKNFQITVALDDFELSCAYEFDFESSEFSIEKVIVGCRSDYCALDNPFDKYLAEIIELENLTKKQISNFFNQQGIDESVFIEKGWIRPFLTNRAWISLIKRNLCTAEEAISITIGGLMRQWFLFQKQRLVRLMGRSHVPDNIEAYAHVFIQAMSLVLYDQGKHFIDFEEGSPWEEQLFRSDWERFFSNGNLETRLIRALASLIRIGEYQWSIGHQAVVKYFQKQKTHPLHKFTHLPFVLGYEGLSDLTKTLRYGRATRERQMAMLRSLAVACRDGVNKPSDISVDDLLRLVYLSKYIKDFEDVSSNAITILNYARVSFAGSDLSRIHIPGADLNGAILHCTNLKNAVITGVNLTNSILHYTDLEGVELTNVNFGQFPYLNAAFPAITIAFRPHNKKTADLSLYNDMSILAVTQGNEIIVYDYNTTNVLIKCKSHKNDVTCVVYSPDGRYIVSGSKDMSVRKWDADTGELVQVIESEKHSDWITCIAYSPCGKYIVTGSYDNSIRQWCVEIGSVRNPSKAMLHQGPVWGAIYNYNGERVISCSIDGMIRQWEAKTNNPFKRAIIGKHANYVSSVASHPKRNIIVSGSYDKSVCQWNTDNGNKKLHKLTHNAPVTCVAFSPDGNKIISGSKDHSVFLWETETGNLLSDIQGHDFYITSAVFNHDGSKIISAAEDKTIRQWKSERVIESFSSNSEHQNVVMCVVFSPDAAKIASCSYDKTVRQWDVKTGSMITMSKGHEDWVLNIAYSKDGKKIVSCSRDKSIRQWDAKTGAPISGDGKLIIGHSDWVICVDYILNDERIVSISHDNTVRQWNARTGKELNRIRITVKDWKASIAFKQFEKQKYVDDPDNISFSWWQSRGKSKEGVIDNSPSALDFLWFRSWVACSPNGKRLVSGSSDGAIRQWYVETGKEIKTEQECFHEDWVSKVTYNQKGNKIASCSRDRSIRQWETNTGKLITISWGHNDLIWDVQYSLDPEDDKLFSSSVDCTIRVWDGKSGKCLCIIHDVRVGSISLNPRNDIVSGGACTIRYWQCKTDHLNTLQWLLCWSIPRSRNLIARNCKISLFGKITNNHRLLLQNKYKNVNKLSLATQVNYMEISRFFNKIKSYKVVLYKLLNKVGKNIFNCFNDYFDLMLKTEEKHYLRCNFENTLIKKLIGGKFEFKDIMGKLKYPSITLAITSMKNYKKIKEINCKELFHLVTSNIYNTGVYYCVPMALDLLIENGTLKIPPVFLLAEKLSLCKIKLFFKLKEKNNTIYVIKIKLSELDDTDRVYFRDRIIIKIEIDINKKNCEYILDICEKKDLCTKLCICDKIPCTSSCDAIKRALLHLYISKYFRLYKEKKEINKYFNIKKIVLDEKISTLEERIEIKVKEHLHILREYQKESQQMKRMNLEKTHNIFAERKNKSCDLPTSTEKMEVKDENTKIVSYT